MSELGELLFAFAAPGEGRFSGMSELADDLPARRESLPLLADAVEEKFSGRFEESEVLSELLHPGKACFAGMQLLREDVSSLLEDGSSLVEDGSSLVEDVSSLLEDLS